MARVLDAIVIGSGPNGLAAGITLAERGLSVRIYEAEQTIGGGVRSLPLTEPGFIHDVCSSVYPLTVSSPLFRRLPLASYGLEWVHPTTPLAHPVDEHRTVVLHRSVDETADGLGVDGPAYRRLMTPMVERWEDTLAAEVLAPPHVPFTRPGVYAQFALRAAWPVTVAAPTLFKTAEARALFAGIAGHSGLRLGHAGTMGFAIVLAAAAHAVGWPFARGGGQRIADALAAHFRSLGGDIVTGAAIESLASLPQARAVLCDTPPAEIARIARDRMTPSAAHRWLSHRHGPGVCKIDWALSAPIPWTDSQLARAGTLHISGDLDEIARAERAPWAGHHHPRPFAIMAQHSLWDASRAPADAHTAWGYCRVPSGSPQSAADAVEAHVERFAPGFRSQIRARNVITAARMPGHNRNLVGGSITAGIFNVSWLVPRWVARPYVTPAEGVYICSASAPPGPGVHGMCGYYAAREAMRRLGVGIRD